MEAYLWGPLWASKRVNFLSDNRSVVEILRSGISRAPSIMSLVRYLCLLASRHSFSFSSFPGRGKSNLIADSLSRFQFQRSPASPSCRLHSDPRSTAAPLGLGTSMSDKCLFYLTQGLTPSARKVYASAQRRFVDFCAQDNGLSPSGSALQPVNMCSSISAVILLILSTIRPRFTFQQSSLFTSRRVCLLCWLVSFGYSVCCGVSKATKAQIGVSANQSS